MTIQEIIDSSKEGDELLIACSKEDHLKLNAEVIRFKFDDRAKLTESLSIHDCLNMGLSSFYHAGVTVHYFRSHRPTSQIFKLELKD